MLVTRQRLDNRHAAMLVPGPRKNRTCLEELSRREEPFLYNWSVTVVQTDLLLAGHDGAGRDHLILSSECRQREVCTLPC